MNLKLIPHPEAPLLSDDIVSYYNKRCAEDAIELCERVLTSNTSIELSSDKLCLTPGTLRVWYYNATRYAIDILKAKDYRQLISTRQTRDGLILFPRSQAATSFSATAEDIDAVIISTLSEWIASAHSNETLVWEIFIPPTIILELQNLVRMHNLFCIIHRQEIRLLKP